MWQLQSPRFEVIQSKQVQYRLKTMGGNRQVKLNLQGWGLVRTRYREDVNEQFQTLSTSWFHKEDQIEVVFPIDAELNVQLVNFWGLFEKSFAPRDWSVGGATRLPITLENFPLHYIKPLGFEFVKVNPANAFRESLWRPAIINIFQRYIKSFSTRMNLATAWPTKLRPWFRNLPHAKPIIGGHKVILPPNLDQPSGTLSGEK